LAAAFALFASIAHNIRTQVPASSPPVAPVEVVTDDYYGTKLDDPYRWMEFGKDPRWMPCLKAQAEHTDA
jgi:hypothetical protein